MGMKHRWRLPFHISSSKLQNKPPPEFLCPISGSLMADPVIVPSGQTFDRNCILACKEFGYNPILPDGTRADLSSLIPNFAIKSTIINWCDASGFNRPKPIEFEKAKGLIQGLITRSNPRLIHDLGMQETPPAPDTKRVHLKSINSLSSDDAETMLNINLPIKPSCCSSSSSSSDTVSCDETPIEDEIFMRISSGQVIDQEEGVIKLRKISRSRSEDRIPLCSVRVLAALRSKLGSKYSTIQVNALAALVNLSLEKENKVRIVRSGAVPPLIDALKAASPEVQEHAVGAIFSLAMEEENRMVIGALGAIPPLLRLAARAECRRARDDAAMALYHLSLVWANRLKLVRLGGVPVLLSLAGGNAAVMAIVGSLAGSLEGRTALLDAHAVDKLVAIARDEALRENCVAVLYLLSQSGIGFKVAAETAGVADFLVGVACSDSKRTMVKARRMLLMLNEQNPGSDNSSIIDEQEKEVAGIATGCLN